MSAEKEGWLQRVRLTAAEPTSWLRSAKVLHQAAEDLWVAGNMHDTSIGSELNKGFTPPETGGSTRNVCFMLLGYALENLAKGIIYCREPNLVKSHRLDRVGQEGHDLVDLFDRARISLPDHDREVLVRATRLTVWKGKYPIPLNFTKTNASDQVLGYIALGDSWPPDEYNALRALYEKAKDQLKLTMKEYPPLPQNYLFKGQ